MFEMEAITEGGGGGESWTADSIVQVLHGSVLPCGTAQLVLYSSRFITNPNTYLNMKRDERPMRGEPEQTSYLCTVYSCLFCIAYYLVAFHAKLILILF